MLAVELVKVAVVLLLLTVLPLLCMVPEWAGESGLRERTESHVGRYLAYTVRLGMQVQGEYFG
jgi:hypothetical protein